MAHVTFTILLINFFGNMFSILGGLINFVDFCFEMFFFF